MTSTDERKEFPGSFRAPLGIPKLPRMLNHLAYVTPDAEATTDFYTKILGLELVNTVTDDKVPSTGDPFPYFHLFFRFADGSTIAFFEAPELPGRNPSPHPAYDIFDHVAFQVDSAEDIEQWCSWLRSNDIEYVGPTDHGILLSIYFRDPVNNIRLELTTPLVSEWNTSVDSAYRELDKWVRAKEIASAEGTYVMDVVRKLTDEASNSGQ